MQSLEVFADIACPFAHAGLARFQAYRDQRGESTPRLVVHAWPLELLNGQPHDGSTLVPKIEALRVEVAPDRFGGFDPDRFPASSIPALEAEAAAHRISSDVGEAFSLAVRGALFDEGLDVSKLDVLGESEPASACLHRAPRIGPPFTVTSRKADSEALRGRRTSSPLREGSLSFAPHDHVGDEYDVIFDQTAFGHFVEAVFA